MGLKRFLPIAMVLYFSYFIHGIGVSILGQYKQNFSGTWGAATLSDGTYDVSMVLTVIAALGLGRLITLPFSGAVSDRFGRRVSGLIGVCFYVLYFAGIAFAPNMMVAYAFALMGGAANSFLDTCVTPTILEVFTKNGKVANMFTKFSISIGQFILPFVIGFVAATNMSYKTIFVVTAVLLVIVGIMIAILPFPAMNSESSTSNGVVKKEKMKFNATSMAVIAMGFTCTATFQLWLNCNQELGKLYGLANPSRIQMFYSLGTMIAVLVTAVLIKRVMTTIQVIALYPTISAVMLLIIYFVETPAITLIGGFVLGYAAAGGVLQLVVATANEMFPTNKGKITSIVMIASSLANYIILTIAGMITKAGGVDGPKYVLLFNVGITVVGILLALFVMKQYANKESAGNDSVQAKAV